jgi:hypothetical protein
VPTATNLCRLLTGTHAGGSLAISSPFEGTFQPFSRTCPTLPGVVPELCGSRVRINVTAHSCIVQNIHSCWSGEGWGLGFWDWGLGIGDWDWGFGIGDWDWGFGIGDWEGAFEGKPDGNYSGVDLAGEFGCKPDEVALW